MPLFRSVRAAEWLPRLSLKEPEKNYFTRDKETADVPLQKIYALKIRKRKKSGYLHLNDAK
jgi:hypothetical protein